MAQLVIDLSSNNREPDWKRLAAWRYGVLRRTRVVGVYIKKSEGVSYTFRSGDGWAGSARKVGLRVGRYHFARPTPGNARAEADYFCEGLHIGARDYRPVLDLEVNRSQMIWADLNIWARQFCQEVFRKSKVLPLIYLSSYWASNIGPAGEGLWLASWSKDGKTFKPKPPGKWKKVVLHQFTSESTGRSPLHPAGVIGTVDISQILIPSAMPAHP